MSHHNVTLLLGSNLGDTIKNIETSLSLLERDVGQILKRSPTIMSEPVEFASMNIFCNIAIVIKTHFSPVKILNSVKKIEKDMGRLVDSSATQQYTDRLIDIDIVQYEDLVFESETLLIPHYKHVFERSFSQELLKNLKTQ